MEKKKNIVKETPEERKLRINTVGNRFFTRIVKSKKIYDRKKQPKIEE